MWPPFRLRGAPNLVTISARLGGWLAQNGFGSRLGHALSLLYVLSEVFDNDAKFVVVAVEVCG